MKKLLLGLFVAAALGGSLLAYRAATAGIRVVVANVGTTAMRNVALHVTGNSYSTPDIQPGNETCQRVFPRGESHLEITFRDGKGAPVRLTVGCYFESDYRGQIRVRVKDGAIESVEDHVSIY